MSERRTDYRHQVKGLDPSGWECVDCGRQFETWPSDAEICPGPMGALTMPALSVRHPWAMLLAVRAKVNETRGWSTNYRGPLALHATKGFTTEERAICKTDPFWAELAAFVESPNDLPLGAVIATIVLENVYPTDDLTALSEKERAFGDYSPGRFAWRMRDAILLDEPIPAKGALGLWKWTTPVVHRDGCPAEGDYCTDEYTWRCRDCHRLTRVTT